MPTVICRDIIGQHNKSVNSLIKNPCVQITVGFIGESAVNPPKSVHITHLQENIQCEMTETHLMRVLSASVLSCASLLPIPSALNVISLPKTRISVCSIPPRLFIW